MKKIMGLLLLLSMLLSACAGATPVATQPPAPAPTQPPAPAEKKIILATTTSTQDSGLLDFLLPEFEKETGIKVEVIAVGTGQAIKLGQDGNADVLLVHSRTQEDAFMKDGHGTRREDVMYNDFVVVGPSEDPARIKGLKTAAEAFKAIAEAKAKFISRGDDSGTHTKEKSIWKAAGIEPKGDWYVSSGQGMGEVLTMATEQGGYTLSDRATYLALKSGLKLEILVEGEKGLYNPYGVITVDPKKSPKINAELATKFVDWIVSLPVQEKISSFGQDKFGQPLFIPQSKAWKEKHPAPQPAATQPAAAAQPDGAAPALKITGLVNAEKSWSEAEIRAMKTIEVKAKNSKGQEDTYTGVWLMDLLNLAGLKPEAKTLVFVADDGYTAEVALDKLQACPGCILSFRTKGGFSSVMPDFPGSLSVKGVVEMQIK